jgi:hypothetical protein
MLTNFRLKTLYLDIDGTIVHEYRCKPALANGIFERAVREVGFERIVCMSNQQIIIKFLDDMGQAPDGLRIIFDLCWGAFRDAVWFRQVTTLVPDPERRARFIDMTGDWWYLDDLARSFLDKEELANVFAEQIGKRILAPEPTSDGNEILRWLRECCTSRNASSSA